MNLNEMFPARRDDGGPNTPADHRSRNRRFALSCESLEGRVVLSHFGGLPPSGVVEFGSARGAPISLGDGSLIGSLSSIGVVSGSARAAGTPFSPWSGQNSQLSADVTKLQNDLQGLAAKSGLTIADLSALAADGQAIADAGLRLDPAALQSALSTLANAVVTNADTAAAKAAFDALLSGSTVSRDVINKAFTDLTQAIKDSGVTAADLSAVAADQTAIKADLGTTSARGLHGGFGDQFLAEGGLIAQALNQTGVVTGLNGSGDFGRVPFRTSTTSSQLTTDLATLKADIQALTAKSNITVADLNSLKTDTQTIAAAGFRIDPSALRTTVTTLVTAVASKSDTSTAQTSFNALFSGSAVTRTVIDKTFLDLVTAVIHSGITAADVARIAADRAAFQADLPTVTAPTGSGTGSSYGGRRSGGIRSRFAGFASRFQ